jgi:hypothetical protein
MDGASADVGVHRFTSPDLGGASAASGLKVGEFSGEDRLDAAYVVEKLGWKKLIFGRFD